MTYGQSALPERDGLARQVPAFLVAGALGFCVDAGLTVALTAGLGVSPYVARPPAVIVATLVTFLINRAFTFRARTGHWPSEFARYCLVAASGQALNYAVYAGALALARGLGFGLSATLVGFCVACGSGAAMAVTFTGFRRFAFRA